MGKIKLLLRLNIKAVDIYKRKKEQSLREAKLTDIRKKQKLAFADFELSIPHTSKSYKANELDELQNLFDVFICGSDQVWTPFSGGFRSVPHKWTYFLKFTHKKKLSYAASFGADKLPDDFEKQVLPLIDDLNAISVREENAKKILDGKVTKEVSVVVDPVMLISEEHWKAIQKEPKEKSFIFAYILGKNTASREAAISISKKVDRTLITIPFIGDYCDKDWSFGDVQKCEATPKEFLGYIKNADYIITDSFHCAVFSLIFRKQFVVLKRSADGKKEAMNSRLTNLLSKVGLEDRVVGYDTEKIMPVLDKKIDYDKVSVVMNNATDSSLDWLEKNIRF